MASYGRNFDFNPGDLGRNLATLDHKVDRAIDRVQEICVAEGEADLKVRAPWTDDTHAARESLWAKGSKLSNGTRRINMGHGVDYGIYLEKSNHGRFQVIMPVLLDTGRKFMRSLEHLFAQLDSPVTVTALVAPGGGVRQGTSQTPVARTSVDRRGRIYSQDARGRFVSLNKAVKDYAAKQIAENKRLARNARRRATYAAKTAVTKRTRRG